MLCRICLRVSCQIVQKNNGKTTCSTEWNRKIGLKTCFIVYGCFLHTHTHHSVHSITNYTGQFVKYLATDFDHTRLIDHHSGCYAKYCSRRFQCSTQNHERTYNGNNGTKYRNYCQAIVNNIKRKNNKWSG